MPFEYEALVGHLYVVGGRAISNPPPGALVEVAPQKAARGRETDTFFVMVLPSRDAVAAASFYTQLAQLAAERYFSSSGSVTAGLRDVFSTLNHDLFEHNQGDKRPYEANIVCAVLRGSDLIVGRVGSAVCAIMDHNHLQTFPEDLSDDEALYIAPLGVQPIPNVKMTQLRVRRGTRIVFGDANLADLDTAQINETLLQEDISDALVLFKELARLQLTLTLVEFVPPEDDAQAAADIPTGQSTTEILTKRNARREAAPEAGAKPERQRRESVAGKAITSRARHTAGLAALGLSRVLGVFDWLLGRVFDPIDDRSRRWLASPLGAGAVVLVPVGVVALVIMLWLSGTGESEFELCYREVNRRAELARSVANNERQTILNAWDVTLSKARECEGLRPDDPTIAALQREGRDVLDALNQINRREATVIDTLPQAVLTRVATQGQDLYVLDSANQRVYQVSLSDDGLSRTRPGTPIPEMRTGAVVSGHRVGEIFDITFNTNSNVIVAVDRDGVVIECSPRFLQCDGQRLLGAENWIEPVAATIWSGRLYILDTGVGQGQIWRYEPVGGSYGNPPTEIFTGTQRPQLRTGIDLEIDEFGNIFVLTGEGVVLKFRGGQPQDFAFSAFPDGHTITSAESIHLNDSPTSRNFYLVNRPSRMIYEVSLSGTFRAAYSIYNDDFFEMLTAVAAAPGRGGRELLYAISGNAVFGFEIGN